MSRREVSPILALASMGLLSMAILMPSVCHGNLVKLDEVARLYKEGGLKSENLRDSDIGYDMKTDYYFFQYKPDDFSTKIYEKRKTIAAGQCPDASNQVVPPSIYPFAVVQKSAHNPFMQIVRPTLTDRFDVKKDPHGNQYFALYDGNHGNRVVNRLRGMLLRKVVNAVKDKLPLLDMVTNTDIETEVEDDKVIDEYENFATLLRKDIGDQIKAEFREVDRMVQMNSRNESVSGAAGSIAIVTKYNLIVAYLGDVRVLTYDQDLRTRRITNDHSRTNPEEVKSHLEQKYKLCSSWASDILQPFFESCGLTRSFGSTNCKVGRYHRAEPEVEFVPRYFYDKYDVLMETQFVILETATVANRVEDKQATKKVVEAVRKFRRQPHFEQAMYREAVDTILGEALEAKALHTDMSDFSVMLVGLEKGDYEKVR